MPYRGSGKIDIRRRVTVSLTVQELAAFLLRTPLATTVDTPVDVPADLEIISVRQEHYSNKLTLTCISNSFDLIPAGQLVPEKAFQYS
jgi:hypothetical protein